MAYKDVLFNHRKTSDNIPFATLAGLITQNGFIVGGSYRQPTCNPEYKKGRGIAIDRIASYIKGEEVQNMLRIFPEIHDREEAIELLRNLDIKTYVDEKGLKRFEIIES